MIKKEKTGRNDPCVCGSGKKYKKCCGSSAEKVIRHPDLAAIIKQSQKIQEEERKRQQLYGKVNPIIHIKHHGYEVVAAGSRVHFSKKWKTFPDFLWDYIKNTLGESWGNAELKKPLEERHQILQWFDASLRFCRSITPDENGISEATPNGPYAAYLLLAYDLFILEQHKGLQNHLIKRLKTPEQFQGVRYELFATATTIRAGFDIAFEDETDRRKKHPEFLATHKETNQKIAIEAKSKHRSGVLGYPGIPLTDDNIKLRITRLINQALRKETRFPLAVFVDLNLPPARANKLFGSSGNISGEIKNTLDRIIKNEKGEDLFNLVIFTNHPHHYGREEESDPKHEVHVMFTSNPCRKMTHPSIMHELVRGCLKYGRIPR